MSTAENPKVDNPLLASQSQQSVFSYIGSYLRRIRAGDLGILPTLLGLVLISLIFQSQNSNFLTPINFVNLIVQMAGLTVIAYGAVFVLLIGEIDLSVGYVSAVCAGVMVILSVPKPDLVFTDALAFLNDVPFIYDTLVSGVPWYIAVIAGLLTGIVIGTIHGAIITSFQLPAFVVTLAGFLFWNGILLIILGNGGTIRLQNDVLRGFTRSFISYETVVRSAILATILVLAYVLWQVWRWGIMKEWSPNRKSLALVGATLATFIISGFYLDEARNVWVIRGLLTLATGGYLYLLYREWSKPAEEGAPSQSQVSFGIQVVALLFVAGFTIFNADFRYTMYVTGFIPIILIGGYAFVEFRQRRVRRSKNLGVKPLLIMLFQIILVGAIVGGVIYYTNFNRGVPVIGLFIIFLFIVLTYVVTSTRYGRYLMAVGGSKEAARRAGIPVELIRTSVFMMSGLMAAIGGMILAMRLGSVSTSFEAGNLLLNAIAAAVIGGTSLFGGRGAIYSALLGALIISAVDNGMGLLGLSSGVKFVVTGLVLLVAVVLDSFSRRQQQRAGIG